MISKTKYRLHTTIILYNIHYAWSYVWTYINVYVFVLAMGIIIRIVININLQFIEFILLWRNNHIRKQFHPLNEVGVL